MLTVEFDRLDLRPGMALLDLGCGMGRHAYEAYRRGAHVVAVDWSADEVSTTRGLLAMMAEQGEAPAGTTATALRGDLTALPFGDGSFDRVVAAEVLEHIPDDAAAMAEIARVLRPGGLAAITVPRWWPETVCWALSEDYHTAEGGHVRIYRGDELAGKLAGAGLELFGSHHAHALHAPYWWLKCAVGVDREHPLPALWHRLLVWDITARPWLTRTAERLLNPVLGKSLVVYLRRAEVARAAA